VKGVWLFLLGALCGAVLAAAPRIVGHLHAALRGGHGGTGEARVHTKEKFAFTANGPIEKVAPLFGADRERVWSPGWNPRFVSPFPAADERGMVFTVAHDHLKATWVNTEFDLQNGRIQYVYVIPDALATVITLRLTPAGEHTQVEVDYDRTALSPEADAHVRHLADGDRRSGPEWEQQVNGYLAGASSR
jgi:hypothetical protein